MSAEKSFLRNQPLTIALDESELRDSAGHGIMSRASTVSVSKTTIEGSAQNAIDATGTLDVDRSRIAGSRGMGISISGGLELSRTTVATNLQGGVSLLTGTFDVVNNFIYRNGNDGGLNFRRAHLAAFDWTLRPRDQTEQFTIRSCSTPPT